MLYYIYVIVIYGGVIRSAMIISKYITILYMHIIQYTILCYLLLLYCELFIDGDILCNVRMLHFIGLLYKMQSTLLCMLQLYAKLL